MFSGIRAQLQRAKPTMAFKTMAFKPFHVTNTPSCFIRHVPGKCQPVGHIQQCTESSVIFMWRKNSKSGYRLNRNKKSGNRQSGLNYSCPKCTENCFMSSARTANFLLFIEKKKLANMGFQNGNLSNIAGQTRIRSYFICILVRGGRLLFLTFYNFIAPLMRHSFWWRKV